MPQASDSIRSGRLVAALLAAAVLAQAGCGSGSDSGSAPTGSGATTTRSDHPTAPAPAPAHEAGGGGGLADQEAADPYSEGAGGSAAPLLASARAYVSAIDRRDARAVCELLVRGALRGVKLPVVGGGCAGSVASSLGHRGAGGGVWQRTRLRGIGPVELDPDHPDEARVRLRVVHRFSGHREPSIEDDLIYLRYTGGRWLVVKPSSTFYRAIGAEAVPLSALTPP